MAQFTVPKFIEREPKIVGPLTFKQFIYVGVAGAICVVLYFTLGKTNFLLFVLLAIILVIVALLLAFVKISGRSLPTVVQNFFTFSISSKAYMWKRKALLPKVIKVKKTKPKKVEEAPAPKITEKARLQKLSTQIETRTK